MSDNTIMYVILVVVVLLIVALVLGLSFGMNSSNLKVVKGPNANKLALFITDSSVGQFVGANGFVFVDANGLPTAKKVNLSESTDVEGVLQAAQIPLFTGDVTNTISKTQLDLGANTVDTAQLKANSVTTDKIADGAVTDAKTNFTNKPPVRLVSTTAENPTTSNLADGRKIDGVTVLTNDLVLLTAEAGVPPSINNGPWVAGVPEGSWPNSRPPWFPTGGTASNGDTIFVLQGTTEAGSHWYISSPSGSFTIGTTAMSWTKVANSPAPPLTFTAPVTILGDNKNALKVTPSTAGGAPTFNVDTFLGATAQTGINVIGQKAGDGALIEATSKVGVLNEDLILRALGTGKVVLQSGLPTPGDVTINGDLVVIRDSDTAFVVAKLQKDGPALQVDTTAAGTTNKASGLLITSQDSSTNLGVLLTATKGGPVGTVEQSLKLDGSGGGATVELNTVTGTGAVVSGQNIEFSPVGDRSLSFGTTKNATAHKLSIIGHPTSAGVAGPIVITAGTPSAGGGGDVTIEATSAVGSGAGGAMTIKTGSGIGAGGTLTVTTGGSSGSNAGNIDFTAGTSSNGAGGNFTVNTGGGTVSGGALLLTAGGASGGPGGPVTIKTGTSTSGAGGAFTVLAGNGTAVGGAVDVTAGSATLGNTNGGAITLTAGAGSVGGLGGAIKITSGAGGASAPFGSSGAVDIASGAVTGAVAGAVTIKVAPSAGTKIDGADLTLQSGNATGLADAGDILLVGGTSGAPTGLVGAVKMTTSGSQLQMKGGAATVDVIGETKLVGGTILVPWPKIVATDRIMLMRDITIFLAPALGFLVYTIAPSVGFTISSLSAASALVATDTSFVQYIIVRQI